MGIFGNIPTIMGSMPNTMNVPSSSQVTKHNEYPSIALCVLSLGGLLVYRILAFIGIIIEKHMQDKGQHHNSKDIK